MHIKPNHTHPGTGNKLISLPTKPTAPDHIGYVVNITLKYEWYDSIFKNYDKMTTSTIFIAPLLRSLLPPNAKILRPIIYFKVKN